ERQVQWLQAAQGAIRDVGGQKNARLERLEAQAAPLPRLLQRLTEDALLAPFDEQAEPVRELAPEDLEQARNADPVLATCRGGRFFAHRAGLTMLVDCDVAAEYACTRT